MSAPEGVARTIMLSIISYNNVSPAGLRAGNIYVAHEGVDGGETFMSALRGLETVRS